MALVGLAYPWAPLKGYQGDRRIPHTTPGGFVVGKPGEPDADLADDDAIDGDDAGVAQRRERACFA